MADLIADTVRGLKSAFSFTNDGRYRYPWRGLPNERQHAELIGDGSGNSIVGSAVNWICANGPQAPLTLVRESDDGVPEVIRKHPFLKIARRPTWIPEARRSWYDGRLLQMALLASFTIDGNAYVYKLRSRDTGKILQRWYLPHWLVEPRWPSDRDNTVYISHYEYKPFGVPVELSPDDVEHYRFGIDPENTRKGWSRLKTVLREIMTDEEAARFTASTLVNFGMPGVLISPANLGEKTKPIGPDERLALKEQFIQNFSGDNRGQPMVLSRPATLEQFGFSPEQLQLSALRDVPEERITSALGVRAAVLGLGTGLQGVKVGATMRMEWDMSWKGGLIPTQAIIAEQMREQLLPEYVTDAELEDLTPYFDYARAGVLHEERMANATYWALLARAGGAKRSEFRAGVGLRVDPDGKDDVYMPSPGVELVDPAMEAPGAESDEGETVPPSEEEEVAA